MALGRFKRTIKRSLSIVMAAALIATSIPQLSASAMAQEHGNANPEFEGRVLENSEGETDSENSEPEEPEQETGKEINEEEPTEEISKAEKSEESTTTESSKKEDSTKEEVQGDKETNTESDTAKETSEEHRENEKTEEDTTEAEDAEEDASDVEDEKGDKVTDNKEENKEQIEENKGGKALRFPMKEVSEWKDLIQEDINAPENLTFNEKLKSDYQVSFDLYLPKEASFSGNYYVKAVTKLGDSGKWTEGTGESVTRDDFKSCEENEKLVRYTFKGAIGEEVVEYDILKAIVISVGSSDCIYNGVMFVDNVKLLDENDTILMLEDFSNYEGAVELGSMEGISEGGDQEESDGIVIYKEDFNSWTSLEKMETPGNNEVEPSLETIAEGNQAIAYSIALSTSSDWADIFKASLKLPEGYDKEITDKVNMTFDVYIPMDSIQSDFGTMKAQAALKVGTNWTWITQKSWPSFQADDLIEDEKVPGYKKYTFSIDMNDFETWDDEAKENIPWDFANITPIQTIIPCLGGDNFKYNGNVYLDNVCVTAYNKTEDVPIAKDDVVLELDTSAWEVINGYQYTGNSTIENKTIENQKLLVAAVDYTADTAEGWSEAKFKYTHPQTVAFEGSYNAFTADVYYKPANKKQGSLAVKISSGSLQNDKGVDAELPEGDAVTGIPELEGYYKSQLELVIETRKDASFSDLELGMVGKNTDFQGDIYFDNMKFTNIEVEDIYVDATVEAKKGNGITVSADGRSITTASGKSVSIPTEVSLVDANANEATKNLYAYLKAIGESDSVIFGHQNDTHHKAGSKAEGFSNSDTKDVTGSIAGVIGIDALSLTGDEASEWNTAEAQRIQKVADITKEAAAEGALITLSAHMPNFDVIDQRVQAFEKDGKTGNESNTLGYWEVGGEKQYNFSGYTPGVLSGNVVARIMPEQDLNYLFTDYLDLIVDYAKAVEDDGITILFRPFHENTGGWFWWGAASCDEEAYINLFRYTVDYIKSQDVHNILYVYGPGSEANNTADYAKRYPGDAYVDMIGYDLYHVNPSKENEAKYLQDISTQNSILKEFATEHNKLYAITETGVANGDKALFPSGNDVKDWYMQLLNEISDDGVCYFLTWANFSNETFYLPFVTKKNEDGTLHGHEMLDDFIKFYNDNRSVFATDMNGGHQQVEGVTNTNKGDGISGYFITPLSGDRILKSEQGTGTRIAVSLSGVKNDASDVKFVLTSDFGKETVTASYVEKTALWEATLEDSVLEKLGEIIGKITLYVGDKEVAAITAIFNLAETQQDDMAPDDFESYGGSKDLLNRAWATNKDTGSEITFLLTNDKEKVFGGNFALQIDVTLQNSNAWAGATKKFVADWSNGSALEFYTIPEKYGQKVVVQVTSGGVIYEAYLQEFEAYTQNAQTDTPVKVTIPFSCFKDRDNKGVAFNPAKIESIGLWCNAIAKDDVTFPLDTTLYYDEIKVVKTDKTEVFFEEAVIPDNPDDPDNPDNPDQPSVSAGIIYSNNFNTETDINNVLDGAENSQASLAELAPGNKAILYKADLTGTTEWTNIFQAQFNLKESYTKEITDKAVMSFDVYFPAESVGDTFGTLKAQAVFKTGSEWKWTAQQSWPSYTVEKLEDDADVPGFKKLHIEMDMNNFKISEDGGEVAATIADIMPIMAVIPCLAGDTSSYKGDIYLDNVKVEAFNRSGDAPELPPMNENEMFLSKDAAAWSVTEGWDYSGESKVANTSVQNDKLLVASVDYSKDAEKGWSEAKFNYTHPKTVSPVSGYNAFQADVYYKPADMTQGKFGIKLFCESLGIDKDADLPEGTPVENIAGLEGYYKSTFTLEFDAVNNASFSGLTLGIVGKNTNFKGDIYFANMRFTKGETAEVYKESTEKITKGSGITIAADGRSITTASGKTVSVASEIALVDANANEATQKLYAYLKAVGESDSVIFGHQNDTHHKAGSTGEGFSNSDTKDITGSIAGVVGIDTLSLTGNEASTWDTPEAERIQFVADLTRSAAAEGAIVTLSAHMPNFDVIDQKVKAFEASNKTGNTSDTLGYWEVNGEKQYNFSGYTPGTLTGNVVTRIMPGQDLNYLYTDYLDLIADYAKAVEKDDITILFRPFHENTGSWFWWGAALCDKEAYINLFRYTVDYLKEQGVHNLLYVYGPGSEAANVVEYAQRYPGDAYVDMIGYDLYHSNPTKDNQAGYLENIRKQDAILREFAQKHNKLYAITETGVANPNNALLPSGNEVLDWYMQLLNEISDDGVCYFLTWANFNDATSFYTPFVKEKRENDVLYGHEMLDEFIRFYNDERSVFATDMHSGFAQLSGITNTTKENVVSGYMVAPLSGDKLLPTQTGEGTRIAAKVAGVDKTSSGVRFVLTSDYDQEVCKAAYNEETKMWEAVLPDYALINLGEGLGTIVLVVNGQEIASISVGFNMIEAGQNDMIPDDFESYGGSNLQLNSAWATNKATGSEIAFQLTDDSEKVFGGNYGLEMEVTLASGDAWAGAEKNFSADWSSGNALEFYTIPEIYGQKVVVQVKSAGEEFEIYLQEYPTYTNNAKSGIPVKVTVPFAAFVGRDNKEAVFNPAKIEKIGLWCNAIAQENVTFPLKTTLYYDELKIVKLANPDQKDVLMESIAKEGVWVREIAPQEYTGKAVKPEVAVYDGAKRLTLKTDYTVTYKNNKNVSNEAKVVIKGKGNYSETIEQTFEIVPKNMDSLTITYPEYLAYNGKEQAIAVTVKDGKKKLSSKKDYSVEILYLGKDDGQDNTQTQVAKAKDEGKYQIKVTGKDNYSKEAVVICEVVDGKGLLTKASIKLPSSSLNYETDKAAVFEESAITVKLSGKTVPQKEADGTVNYTISYVNNTAPGTATMIITAGKDSAYVGSCRKDFTVKGAAFSAKAIGITEFQSKLSYTGKPVFQNPVLTDKATGTELKKGVDYKVTYKNHVNAGKAAMQFTGIGKYSGTFTKTYTISKAAITEDMLTSENVMEVLQNRAGVQPDVVLLYNGMTLVNGQDYTLTYSNNKNITTDSKKAYITIKGKGSFTGTLRNAVEMVIRPKSLNSSDITIEVPDMQYGRNKAQYTPNPIVYDNGKKLVKNKDYTVSYESNTKQDIGEIKEQGHTAKVIITAKGADYFISETAGDSTENTQDNNTRIVEFRIIEKLIKDAKVTVKNSQYFSQQGTMPSKEDLEITYKNTKVEDTEYEILSYSQNTKKGNAVMVIQGVGNYGGTKTVKFKINARGMEQNWADKAAKVFSSLLEWFS